MSSPAGQPSISTPTHGPCDSPRILILKSLPNVFIHFTPRCVQIGEEIGIRLGHACFAGYANIPLCAKCRHRARHSDPVVVVRINFGLTHSPSPDLHGAAVLLDGNAELAEFGGECFCPVTLFVGQPFEPVDLALPDTTACEGDQRWKEIGAVGCVKAKGLQVSVFHGDRVVHRF